LVDGVDTQGWLGFRSGGAHSRETLTGYPRPLNRAVVITVTIFVPNIAPDISAFLILSIVVSKTETKSMIDRPAIKPTTEIITLKQLCTELKIPPREARERLRLAVRDAKKNPELAKSHKPGQTWEWPKNSPALKEVRTVLTA
jgi:hypothetical protein